MKCKTAIITTAVLLQTAMIAPAKDELTAPEKRTIALFENAQPSVIYITNIATHRSRFTRNIQEIPQGTGSGFIWDNKGHVVTNFHVIKGATTIRVTLYDQKAWDAELVGTAPDKDIAVLRIKAPKTTLKALALGKSDSLKVGQNVYAIGNPFGFDYTLTTGVISGLGREIQSVTRRPIQDVIQTDAAINPGNSGGPLLNSSGRLIGVNTSIYSPTGSYAGIGFAVPVDTVKRIVPQLIEHGQILRPGLGVTIAARQIAERLGVNKGILIIDTNGSAEGKLQPTTVDEDGNVSLGDVILTVEDIPLEKQDDLYRTLDGKEIGSNVKLEISRQGKKQTVIIKLQGLE